MNSVDWKRAFAHRWIHEINPTSPWTKVVSFDHVYVHEAVAWKDKVYFTVWNALYQINLDGTFIRTTENSGARLVEEDGSMYTVRYQELDTYTYVNIETGEKIQRSSIRKPALGSEEPSETWRFNKLTEIVDKLNCQTRYIHEYVSGNKTIQTSVDAAHFYRDQPIRAFRRGDVFFGRYQFSNDREVWCRHLGRTETGPGWGFFKLNLPRGFKQWSVKSVLRIRGVSICGWRMKK